MPRRSHQPSGFTVIEVTVVVAVLSLALQLFVSNYTRTQDFAEHEQARMRNIVKQQEGLRTLEVLLQAVDFDSLAGFDGTGTATAPTFRRWLHDASVGVQLGPVERIEWEAHGDVAGDVKSPGRLVRVSGTDRIVIADRVPSGGFSCRLDGRQLTIEFETFYPTASNEAVRTTARTAVFLGRGDG